MKLITFPHIQQVSRDTHNRYQASMSNPVGTDSSRRAGRVVTYVNHSIECPAWSGKLSCPVKERQAACKPATTPLASHPGTGT